METIYLVIVLVLLCLAIFDLVVGVSNDAVNFLNSAVGSKVAPRKIIMWVATAGILVGVLTSSGMMEVARNGIFHPGMFSFREIMMLFLAVMLTDVILLDVFNTFGLPTSTTVSLVFELLGAAVCVSLFSISASHSATLADLPQYINSGKALGIISGILVSVVVAFVCGAVVMYITRIIFSYKFHNKMRGIGALWCGFALTAITYFAVFKGLKNTPVIPAGWLEYINANMLLCLGVAFVFWTLLMSLLAWLKVNTLKITVLAGTFALALAFAGNDLVNFIGVFMAGFDSYQIASHTGDTSMMMGELAKPVQANMFILLASGIVMILTLWFSKKARRVIDTEVNLAKQDAGNENFGSTSVSRAIVRQALAMNKFVGRVVPQKVQRFINGRFDQSASVKGADTAPFDLIRATVNLTMAALLIASATSLKLPLSTTYVSFMVAMGTSLADRAWGRESAVYRITGVMTVIMGWFVTAFVAFLISFVVAMLLMWGGMVAMAGLVGVAVWILIRSNFRKKKNNRQEVLPEDEMSVLDKCSKEIVDSTRGIIEIYNSTLEGVFSEDGKNLKKNLQKARELHNSASERKYNVVSTLELLKESNIETAHYYVQVADYLNEVTKSILQICKSTFEHIDNSHEGMSAEQIADLKHINDRMNEVFAEIEAMLVSNDFANLNMVMQLRDSIFEDFAQAIKRQIKRDKDNMNTTRSSVLYLNILTENKIIVLQLRNLLKAQKYLLEQEQ